MTPKMTPIYVAKMTPTIRAAIATLFPSWNATGVKQWTQAEDPRSPTKMASRLFLLSALLLLAISIVSSCVSFSNVIRIDGVYSYINRVV
ncbi:hypothetical protein LINPERHAP2_LOCUS36922, partial [Linum perenne]